MKIISIIFLALILIIVSLFLITIISSLSSPEAAKDKTELSNPPETATDDASKYDSDNHGQTTGSYPGIDTSSSSQDLQSSSSNIEAGGPIQEKGQDSSNETSTAITDSKDENNNGKIAADTKTQLHEQYSIQKLVFQSNRNGNEDIYSINLNGSGLQRLTDNAENDLYPEVSPDSKKIAYTADISGTWQIFIMDPDGSNKIQITSNDFRSGYPSWSYDGKYIFFEGFIDGDWELFRIESSGNGQERLTYNSDSHDWHPNGHHQESKVLFESGTTGYENIFIMDYDGSDIMPLFNDGHRRRAADLSTDCNMITYTKYFDDNSEVYYMDFRNGTEIRVTDNMEWDGHPAFTPDDRYIVFEQNITGTGVLTLFEIATGKKIKVTDASSSDSDASALYQK